jgi:hypothetical protein
LNNVRLVPISAPNDTLFSVSFRVNRHSDSVGEGLLCALNGLPSHGSERPRADIHPIPSHPPQIEIRYVIVFEFQTPIWATNGK